MLSNGNEDIRRKGSHASGNLYQMLNMLKQLQPEAFNAT